MNDASFHHQQQQHSGDYQQSYQQHYRQQARDPQASVQTESSVANDQNKQFDADLNSGRRNLGDISSSESAKPIAHNPNQAQQFTADVGAFDKKIRFNSVPGVSMQPGALHFSQLPPMAGFNPSTGAGGGPSNEVHSMGSINSQRQGPGAIQNLMGIGMADYSMYAAALSAASSNPSGFVGALPMAPQPSHSSSSSSGASSSIPHYMTQQQPSHSPIPGSSGSNLHQRTLSAMAGLPMGHAGQPPQSPSSLGGTPQYGMVGPASFASAAGSPPSSQPSPFPNINHPNPSSLSAASAMAAALNAGYTSPLSQAMSAMSSFTGHGGSSSNNSTAGGMQGNTPISPATAYTPGFGSSPATGQSAFNSAAGAAGLGMPGVFGIGGFGMPGMGVGGLGMTMSMGSPNLSQHMNDMANLSLGETQPVIRTVYVGNLPGDASVDELLSQVRYGPIESVKILPDKSCAFISFLDPGIAAAFHSDANLRKVQLHGQELKIGWGKATSIPVPIMQAVQQHGATRNVYLGNLDEAYTEQSLRDDLSSFGHIDQVKIVRDKNIGFVHFLSIANAIKVVAELPKSPAWQGRRVNYGKDRCAYVPRNQHQQQQHNQLAAAMAAQAASQYIGYPSPYLNSLSPQMSMSMSPVMSPLAFQGGFIDPNIHSGSRTVYLGNLHPETTCEDVCNTIRGGILQEIRYIPDRHICFVSFVMAESALALYQYAAQVGITVKNRRLKIGWGKNNGPCPPGIAAIVAAGGSRNVYIGNIDDFAIYTLEKIKTDLGEYGEIEQVNTLEEKSCAFVNFTKISSAVKAIEALKQHSEYSKFKIAYGKDRVGNLTRSPFIRRAHGHYNNANYHNINSPLLDNNAMPSMGNIGEDALVDSLAGGDSAEPQSIISPRDESQVNLVSPQASGAVSSPPAVSNTQQAQ